MAQRFPGDFDGIFSRVPVINWVGLQVAGTRAGAAQFGGGWLWPGQGQARARRGARGLRCARRPRRRHRQRLRRLQRGLRRREAALLGGSRQRLPYGHATKGGADRCISRYELSFTLANGVRSYPAWGRGGESAAGHRSGRRLAELADRHRAADAAARADEQPRLALRQRRGRNTSSRAIQSRSRASSIPRNSPTACARFRRSWIRPIPICRLRRARRQAHHQREHGRLCAKSVRRHRLLPVVVAKHGAGQRPTNFLRLYVTPGADHMGVGAPFERRHARSAGRLGRKGQGARRAGAGGAGD